MAEEVGDRAGAAVGHERGVHPVFERGALAHEVQTEARPLALGSDARVGEPDRGHELATGELGQRVCRLLRRWTPSVRVVGANRSGRGHPDFPVHRVDVRDERTLVPALREVSLVVNAVGPYLYDPAPLVRACVRARAHLVALADDVAWFGAAAEAASRAGAAAAGVAVIPGCSTVPGLVSLLAQRWAARSDVASLSALLSLGILPYREWNASRLWERENGTYGFAQPPGR